MNSVSGATTKELYNNDRKRIFLGMVSKKWKTMDPYQLKHMFETASVEEEKLSKDVSDWNKEEILSFLKQYETTEDGLKVVRYTMRMYTEDMIAAGLATKNNWDNISPEEIFDCVSPELKQMYPTREELLKRISTLRNSSDKFLLLGSFEGIGAYGVKYYEFRHAKLSDINMEAKTLMLHSNEDLTRIIEISDELIHFAVLSEDKYTYTSEFKNVEWPYNPDYIIKRQKHKAHMDSQKNEDDKFAFNVLRRMNAALSLAGFSNRVKAGDLRKAGCMDMVKRMIDSGIPRKEVISEGYPYRDIIINQYGYQIVKYPTKFWWMYDEIY